jgi:hypothetical protein
MLKRAYSLSGDGGVSSVTLRPIMQRNYWRVEITWPDHRPRHFGKFRSRAEAEKWIEEHHWLTEQTQEPKEQPTPNRQ